MQLAGMYHTSFPSVTNDDAAMLAAELDLTADTGSADTDYLKRLFRRALDAIERHTGRIMRSSGIRLDIFAENESSITLPVFPVNTVTSVSMNGVEITDYMATNTATGTVLTFLAPVAGNLIVDVTAGYISPVLPPPTFEAAVIALAADMYEHRESQSEVNLYENRQLTFVLADLMFYNCG